MITRSSGDARVPPVKAATPVVALALLASLLLFIYAPALHGPFALDDWRNITKNPSVHMTEVTPDALIRAATPTRNLSGRRPVAFLTFAFDYRIHGPDPAGFRMTNMIILILSLPLALFLALQVSRSWHSPAAAFAIATAATLLWAANPLLTNGITYVVQRMTSLGALFSLAALASVLAGLRGGRFHWYAAGVLFWALALGTKETALTLPLVLALFLWLLPSRDRRLSRGAGLLLLAGIAVSQGGLLLLLVSTDLLPVQDFTHWERLLTQGRVILHYLSLWLLPLPSRMNLVHDFTPSVSLLKPLSTAGSLLAHLLLAGCAIWMRRKRPLFSFGILAFYLTQLVEGTFIPLALIFEHRVYFPSYFLSLAVADLLFLLFGGIFRGWGGRALLAAAVVTALFWGALTHQRNRTWAGPVTLWSDVVAKSPGNYIAHNNLGKAFLETERPTEAATSFTESIRLKPSYAEARHNLAEALSRDGRHAEALFAAEEALRLKPDLYAAHRLRGKALFALGRYEEAVVSFRRALLLGLDLTGLYNNIGASYGAMGRHSEARDYYLRAIRIDPDYSLAHYNMALSALRLGRFEEAREAHRTLSGLNPALAAALLKAMERRGR